MNGWMDKSTLVLVVVFNGGDQIQNFSFVYASPLNYIPSLPAES